MMMIIVGYKVSIMKRYYYYYDLLCNFILRASILTTNLRGLFIYLNYFG